MATLTEKHNPSWVLLPCNNDRTAWRSFGLPVLLVVPHRRDLGGTELPNSEPWSARVAIEGAPTEALVVGHDHIGMRYPDRELYARTIQTAELLDRRVDLSQQNYRKTDGSIVDRSQAEDGDNIIFTTASGVRDDVEYLASADYYDLSDIQVETEFLPPRRYNLVYSCEFYLRIILDIKAIGVEELLCIDITKVGLAAFRFGLNHPGEVMEDMYRLTPPPYFTSAYKAIDSTVSLYRPFSDALQDAFDEQRFIESRNWVSKVPYEAIPYLSAILGWDIPYFPESIDQLRRVVLRQTVELQQLKGSRRALTMLMGIFGFEILINNLWYAADGKRFIGPGDRLPPLYSDQEIKWRERFQVDPLLAGYVTPGFGQLSIPLLYRPQRLSGLDPFRAAADSGNVVVDAYLVATGGPAAQALDRAVAAVTTNPDGGCWQDQDGFIHSDTVRAALVSLEVVGHSQVLIIDGVGVAQVLAGVSPPVTQRSLSFSQTDNTLSLTFDGYLPLGNLAVYAFAAYKRQEVVVPDALANLQSNRFDIQILSADDGSVARPELMDFLLDFVFRIKAFHSLLNVVRYRLDLTEVYPVSDNCVGGDVLQRYNTDAGRQQVPPAIIPKLPTDHCDERTLEGLGYKKSDLLYRAFVLRGLIEEFAAWAALLPNCAANPLGQSRTTEATRLLLELRDEPPPTAGQSSVGSQSNLDLSPIDLSPNDTGVRPAQDSSDNDSSSYGHFMVEGATPRAVHCKLDGRTDYCYQGRVADQILYQLSVNQDEVVKAGTCGLTMGTGIYWSYPVPANRPIPGVDRPARISKTRRSVYSATATEFGNRPHLTGPQAPYLMARYDRPLPDGNNSYLGRLLRGYDAPAEETIHYSNRPYLGDLSQRQELALDRPSLAIEQRDMHLPGCRFPMMNRLPADFQHPDWRAKPWDEPYCLPRPCCDGVPDWLDGQLVPGSATEGTEGWFRLEYRDLPYALAGNGLTPDIQSLSEQPPPGFFSVGDVVHQVYAAHTAGHPALSLDGMQEAPSSEPVPVGRAVFRSATPTPGTSGLSDYPDGYPAWTGFVDLPPPTIDRDRSWAELLAALGVPVRGGTAGGQVLFLASSGILVGQGSRLDCGCTTQADVALCQLDLFVDERGDRDFGGDQVAAQRRMVLVEEVGVSSFCLDGSIPSLLEVNLNG